MKKWFIRVLCVLILAFVFLCIFTMGKVSYAASGTPEFGQVLNAILDGWKELLKAFKEIIILVFEA